VPPKPPKDEEKEKPDAADAAPAEEKGGGSKKERGGKGKDKEGKEGKDGKEGKSGKSGKAGAPGTETKRKKPIPDNPNFRYIVRLAGSDLDGTRATGLALTGVRGIGPRISEVTCRMAGVNPAEMIGNLPEATVESIEQTIGSLREKLPLWMVNHPVDYQTGEARHYIGPDLETARRDDVNQMRMVRSYKGVRHERGQKVRGQRTRSNGRTGMAAGVLKKAAKEAAAAKGAEGGAAAAPAAPAAAAAEEKKA
jgi:small subunit ribosomal protein S13